MNKKKLYLKPKLQKNGDLKTITKGGGGGYSDGAQPGLPEPSDG